MSLYNIAEYAYPKGYNKSSKSTFIAYGAKAKISILTDDDQIFLPGKVSEKPENAGALAD